MATTTSNLGLVKPTDAEYALITDLNANSDKIDAEVGKERSNFALVQNGDTATQAISKDQLVVWKGVLKKATANIASGATLSGSNLSDDTIAAELAALNSKMTILQPSPRYSITLGEALESFSGQVNTAKSVTFSTSGWYVFNVVKAALRFEGNLTGISNGSTMGLRKVLWIEAGTYTIRYLGDDASSEAQIYPATVTL